MLIGLEAWNRKEAMRMESHRAFTRRSLTETLVSVGRARMKSADRYAETAADLAGTDDDRAGASEAYFSGAREDLCRRDVSGRLTVAAFRGRIPVPRDVRRNQEIGTFRG